MYAMQYEVGLPADYDMKVIRQRVATRGHMLDRFDGLGLKAYLIRERGVESSLVNEYAPFYVWADTCGMARFLFQGGGFGGIVTSFGRPVVRHWTGIAFRRGQSAATQPAAAVKRAEKLLPDVDPQVVAQRASDDLAKLAKTPGLHSAAVAIDPGTWELVQFSLWETRRPETSGETRYQVLHVSQPHVDALRNGAR